MGVDVGVGVSVGVAVGVGLRVGVGVSVMVGVAVGRSGGSAVSLWLRRAPMPIIATATPARTRICSSERRFRPRAGGSGATGVPGSSREAPHIKHTVAPSATLALHAGQ